MKRFLGLAVLAASLFVSSQAHAQQASGVTRWTWDGPVRWITSLSAYGKNGGVFQDSVTACGAATGRSDTTQTIDISGWALYPKTALAALDSTVFAIVQVTGVGSQYSVTDAYDSVFVHTDVSMDGSNWLETTPYGGGMQGFNTTSNTGGFQIDNVANTFGWYYKNHYGAATSPQIIISGATAADWRQLWGWNFIRLRLRHGTGDGCYSLRIGHWTVSN